MRDLPGGFRRASRFVLAVSLISLCLPSIGVPAPAEPAAQGRDLFVGRAEFRNGGPPCGACHAAATLPFPNGGLVGPDLSGVSQMLGPDGVDATLQTLFFPTMMPLYDKRPLTVDEQRTLKAFLEQASGPSAAQRDTLALAALALGGCLVLIAVSAVAWRHRLRAVRAALVLASEGRSAGVPPVMRSPS